MRISTNMIFEGTISSLNDKTAALLKTQQQISSGKRILTPSDDPVAAAQVLELNQSASLNTQYMSTQGTAKSTLGLIDSQLSSVTDMMGRIRELAVQGGSATLSASDRSAITTELRARFDQLVGIANSTDGNGQYLFSGYQGSSKPFAGSVESGVSYLGDDGQRAVRVSGSRLMPLSVAGNDIFMNVKSGNGVFATAPQSQRSANTGTASIDAGTVTDPVKWTSASTPAKINVSFWTDTTNVLGAGAGAVYYDVVDASSGNSLITGAPPDMVTGTGMKPYNPAGTTIPLSNVANPTPPPVTLDFDFGASVTVTGMPASGDTFALTKGSSATASGGNNYFTTGPLMTAASNSGSGLISTGTVVDQSKWNSSANSGQLEVRFWTDTAGTIGAPNALYYDLVDAKDGKSLFTGNPSDTVTGAGMHAYTSGNAISFSGLAAPYNDFGASVTITGTPANGDAFSVKDSAPSGLFTMLAGMINAIETPSGVGGSGDTQRHNLLGGALASLSQVEDNILSVRADIGSRLNELDDLGSAAQSLDTQYQGRVSDLEGVDYNKAITDLTRQQTELQATQQSFVKISGLSLFNYL